MRKELVSLLTAATAAAVPACGRSTDGDIGRNDVGQVQVAITKAPQDVACVRVTVTGARTSAQSFNVTPGVDTTFTIGRLPVGLAQVSGEAFAVACSAASVAAYVTDAPVSVRVDATSVVAVVLKLIRNARLSVGVDFEASPSPYLVPVAPGVVTKALLTAGDSVGGYRMVGIPDGLGAFSNGDGTFTLLSNHELTSSVGVPRAHGAKGAFVSRWTVRASDLTVLKGEDLIKQIALWDGAAGAYAAAATGVALSRLCSADLPARSALFDAPSGLGFDGRLFLDGEENGDEGRALAHGLDGTSWELPRLGNQSFENVVANPGSGPLTIVATTDDSTPGQIYFYVGNKTATGSPVERAGLTNGKLFGLAVTGVAQENDATGIAAGSAFTLADLGNVEALTGADINAASDAAGVTRFNRPEDGAWDPAHPNDFYWVTTASFTGNSRLWRVRFNDLANPAAGGTIDMLLSGTEGHKMLDNITVDRLGHVYAEEDVGNNDHIGRLFRYDIATDTLTVVAQHDPLQFAPGAPFFLTRDEESSGIIDASDLLGPGWFLLDVQAHFTHPDAEIVEGGQYLALFDPAATK